MWIAIAPINHSYTVKKKKKTRYPEKKTQNNVCQSTVIDLFPCTGPCCAHDECHGQYTLLLSTTFTGTHFMLGKHGNLGQFFYYTPALMGNQHMTTEMVVKHASR